MNNQEDVNSGAEENWRQRMMKTEGGRIMLARYDKMMAGEHVPGVGDNRPLSEKLSEVMEGVGKTDPPKIKKLDPNRDIEINSFWG